MPLPSLCVYSKAKNEALPENMSSSTLNLNFPDVRASVLVLNEPMWFFYHNSQVNRDSPLQLCRTYTKASKEQGCQVLQSPRASPKAEQQLFAQSEGLGEDGGGCVFIYGWTKVLGLGTDEGNVISPL